MDFKTSRKEMVYQPTGSTMTLKDGVFDLYPVYANALDQKIITDVEILDDEEAELLDRAMFAVVKQRGMDPVEPSDGIQWAEAISGEAPAVLIPVQVAAAVRAEGPGVSVQITATPRDADFTVRLTNTPAFDTM